MTNIFTDQRNFMVACDQSVDHFNEDQFKLYKELIREEYQELVDATSHLEELDALIDILVVTAGAIHSMGADGEGAWNEVVRSNLTKVDPVTLKVRKREDGKVLKGPDYSPPDLEPFLKK